MYAELHARSAFSFLEGASLPEDLIARAADLGLPAVALLDRDCISGVVRFHQAAKKAGLRALIGAEITAAEGFRYPLIAETRQGYQNLCRLITHVKLNRLPGVSLQDLEKHAGGLICLTRSVHAPWERLSSIFGPRNVFVELQRHYQRDEEALNQAAIEKARQLNLPLLATNGVSYATPMSRELQDILTCTRHGTTIHEAGRLLERNAERYLKPEQEMLRLFGDVSEAVHNAGDLASRISYTLENLGYQFPPYPAPPGETMDSFLWQRVDEGARKRFRPYHARAQAQIERELKLIEKLGLAGYFLIVWDIVEFCRREGILAQGRGSAANSAVCYALGITAVNPIQMDLLFERFLSEERGEWPDIDIDLPSGDDRERAIQYVYQRYGRLGAAMTANVITYRTRSALRDVGKALGFDEAVLRHLSKHSARGEWEHSRKPLEGTKRALTSTPLTREHPLATKFFELTESIQSLPRHLGQHSGGMVICAEQLDAIVPLQPATMPGRVIVQWDKDDCADMGIIKVDLLGLGMMAVLKDTVSLIRNHHKEEIDLAHLPPDDPAVYETLQRADTMGLFQVESRAQMSCLPRLKPRTFYDIVVEVAIIRPGPIVGNMLHPYLRRREGEEEPVSLHPLLEPVLKRTLGVPLFQEQLLRMAMIVADFSGGEAEELRRAMGFKRSEQRMADIEKRLRFGMDKKGIIGDVQDRIVQSITSFALYGFPESHAISFALIAYASAWLKCNYLAAFTAAMLNNQPMGFYSPLTLVKDAQRHALRFQPVDVTRSDWPCTLEEHDGDWQVRLGLNYVKGLSKRTGEMIVARRTEQPFTGIDDFTRRVRPSRNEVTALAELGALNSLSNGAATHRREVLWHAEASLRQPHDLLAGANGTPEPSPLAQMRPEERLEADVRNSGLTIGAHPMRYRRAELSRHGITPAVRLASVRDGAWVHVAGIVICRQQPQTAKGFVFLSLEDETGIANAILRPDVFERFHAVVLGNSALILRGPLQNQKGVVSVKVRSVRPLSWNSIAVSSHDFR
jgi:error-prone DNA polymerase